MALVVVVAVKERHFSIDPSATLFVADTRGTSEISDTDQL